MTDYLSQISNNIAVSISKQKDKLLLQVLKENNIDISNLTELVNRGKFLKWEGKPYTTFNYDGRDLLIVYEPEITCKNYKISCEVKYKKLY